MRLRTAGLRGGTSEQYFLWCCLNAYFDSKDSSGWRFLKKGAAAKDFGSSVAIRGQARREEEWRQSHHWAWLLEPQSTSTCALRVHLWQGLLMQMGTILSAPEVASLRKLFSKSRRAAMEKALRSYKAAVYEPNALEDVMSFASSLPRPFI